MKSLLRLNQLGLLLGMSLVVLILSIWSLIAQPTATLLITLPNAERRAHTLSEDEQSTAWWHMRLLMDGSDVAAGVVASATDGAGLGHQLHWDPKELTWRIVRLGNGPKLLAQGQLSSTPRRLSLYRFGYRLELRVNDRAVLSSYDLTNTPGAKEWALIQEHEGPEHKLEVHNQFYLASVSRSDQEAYQQLTVILDAFISSTQNHNVLYGQAGNIINFLGEDHNAKPHLWAWTMWAYASRLINRGNSRTTGTLDEAIDYLKISGAGTTAPSEIPGLLLDLQEQAARKAEVVPESPTPASEFIHQRRAWLSTFLRIQDVYQELTSMDDANRRGYASTNHGRFLGLMSTQIALLMSGEKAAANPAEAPSWLTTRIRALEGRLPFERPLPEIQRHWFNHTWQRPAMDRLISLTGNLDNAKGIDVRAKILTAIREDQPDQLQEALSDDQIDPRIRVICHAILAIHGSMPVKGALDALNAKDADGISLVERDPLAYALMRLVHYRRSQEIAALNLAAPSWVQPPGLTPYRQLLDGGYGATIIAFSRPGDTMPPPEALASAMAMQEVSGIRPDWELLDSLPSFSLPLSLLVPPPITPQTPFVTP